MSVMCLFQQRSEIGCQSASQWIISIIVYQSAMKLLESSPKIAQIEARLSKYTYLSKNNLPGYPDAVIFKAFKKNQKYPDRSKNPNLYYWYILLRQFAETTLAKWIEDKLYFDADDHLLDAFNPNLTTDNAPSFREQISSDLKLSKGQPSSQVQYEIDILLKDYSSKVIDSLRETLEQFKLEISVSRQTKEVKIRCGAESSKREQIVNLISKTVEYQNLQVKKDKKYKVSLKEENIKE